MQVSHQPRSGQPIAPAIIRGRIVESDLAEFGGRNGDLSFLTPNPASIAKLIPMGSPTRLRDVHALKVEEIVDYLEALGRALVFERNTHLQEALELTIHTAPTTPPLVAHQYRRMSGLFTREQVEDMVRSIGRPYLEGWVEEGVFSNGARRFVRAVGARTLHIIAGNSPMTTALTVMRNAVTRSDAVIKAPSNDPFTAIAVARTMIDMAPDHPITKHLSVAYWKGGDEAASGPFEVTEIGIQPGLELISLDPKRSISIVGKDALADDTTMDEVAVRIAADFGGQNQEVCANARVVYVISGSDDGDVEKVCHLGERVYKKLLGLPERPKGRLAFGPELVREGRRILDAFIAHRLGKELRLPRYVSMVS